MATRPMAQLLSYYDEPMSPITKAKNVLTDDGQNLQDILSDKKEDMMTPIIENSSSMFKVGQGDNVDYSENVVDGAYESCVLKGKSLVNILKTPVQTLSGGDSGWKRLNPRWSLKANTKYFALYFVDSNTLNGTIKDVFKYGDDQTTWGIDVVPIGGVGVFKRTFTLSSEVTEYNCYTDTSTTGSANVKCVLLEYQEGMENWDFPYFEGLCDVKSPILTNVGKNLFDKSKVKREKYQNYNISNGAFSITDHSNYKVTDYIRVKPNTPYVSINLGDGAYYTINKKPIKTTICKAGNFTTPNEAYYVVLNMPITQDEDVVRFEEAPLSTTYEPHKSNTVTFSTDDDKTIVLRSLPNGVCDTLNVETGKYVQRIGEVVFDGSNDEVMWFNTGWTNGECVACYWNVNAMGLPNKKVGTQNMVCDSFSTAMSSIVNTGGIVTREGIWGEVSSSVMYISIKKTKLTELNVTGFRQWASQNPITVQYELETPIVTTIDIQGFPYAYTNGHVQLSSGSIEQSLTPTVEYSVITNRNGQIRSNQKMVERQQKELDHLQAMVLANMVETQYRQALMKLKSDLKSEVRV